jgi:3-oxoadipate enol-lactonase
MQKHMINDINIAYERREVGTPLVLIHGFPLDHTTWDGMISHLEGQADVILPDLRGLGQSELAQSGAPQGAYTVADMAADIAGLLDALEIQKAVIVGHSMGGYVALAFARAYPQRLAGLGLVSTQALADNAERKAGRYATAEQVAAQGVAVVAEAMAPKLSVNPNLVPTIRELILRQPAAGVIGALKAMAERPDSTELLSTIKVPVAIVVGQDDALIPPARSHEMKALIPHAVLIELPGVGHSPMLEAPIETAQALKKALL